MLIAKLIRDTKNEEFAKDFFMWERDSQRTKCSTCSAPFSLFLRRHHCRLCGGLFCDPCTVSNLVIDGETYDRICFGCQRGESPGPKIRTQAESHLSQMSAPSIPFTMIPTVLEYGSTFEPNSLSKPNKPAPTKGYFEFINKATSFCCVKVLVQESLSLCEYDTWWEVPRPSYISVPPNELIHVLLPPGTPCIELYILHGNPNVIPGDGTGIHYDTRKPIKPSPCATVTNFWEISVYSIKCLEKNILLKYKGEGIVETRIGSSMERKGVLSRFTGKIDESELNFSTNISPSALSKII